MLKNARAWVLVLGMTLSCATFAAGDPTMHEVYEAAQAGRLSQAQQMIEQVLRDHPASAKAHYVAAEVYAKEGRLAAARQELTTARSLQPGLAFASPQSVQALERQLSGSRAFGATGGEGVARSSFPWGTVLLLVGAGLVLWAVFRRRSIVAPPAYYPGAASGGGYGPGGYGGPGMAGGGLGSGIAGGLASGLAVGAGVVAGEELARHFLDPNHASGGIIPSADAAVPPENGDMGGNDFGISDGGSWDDGGGSFGGDDWS